MKNDTKKIISLLLPWFYLALGMNIFRIFLVEANSYVWLNWNLFLALLPILFLYTFRNTEKKIWKLSSFLAWLFILPNATYLITDLIHLRGVGPEWILWYDGMMIFAYSLVGIISFAFTLNELSKSLYFWKEKHVSLFVWLTSFLAAFGIYLGRYIRWNTWDIVTRPFSLIANVFEIIFTKYADPVFILTLILFTLLGVCSVNFVKKIY